MKRLREEGVNISRITFYKLEKKGLFASKRAAGGWRVYDPKEVEIIVRLVKDNYNIN